MNIAAQLSQIYRETVKCGFIVAHCNITRPHESSKNWVAEKLLLSDINFLTTPLPSVPSNMQLSDNFVIMLQRRTTNMQRCSEAYATMSKLYCCSDIASALDSKINLQCTLKLYWQRCCNVEIATLVFPTSILRRQIHNFLPALPQHWIVNSLCSISWMS